MHARVWFAGGEAAGVMANKQAGQSTHPASSVHAKREGGAQARAGTRAAKYVLMQMILGLKMLWH